MFSNGLNDIERKKRSLYNNSVVNTNPWTRKKKLGNFKKRKKKYRKSVIGKGIHIVNQHEFSSGNVPDTAHAIANTHYFQDNQS